MDQVFGESIKFFEFRDEVLSSFAEYGVEYKLFGGAVVQLVNPSRFTEDLDIAIKATVDSAEKFIDSLASIGYADRNNISMQVYGDVEEAGYDMTSTRRIESSNPEWERFHIDLCFDLGEHNYETMLAEDFEVNGLKIMAVTFRHIIRMKANMNKGYGGPRPKDIEDIQFLANYLGLDPSTGESIVEKQEKKRVPSLDLFGGDKK